MNDSCKRLTLALTLSVGVHAVAFGTVSLVTKLRQPKGFLGREVPVVEILTAGPELLSPTPAPAAPSPQTQQNAPPAQPPPVPAPVPTLPLAPVSREVAREAAPPPPNAPTPPEPTTPAEVTGPALVVPERTTAATSVPPVLDPLPEPTEPAASLPGSVEDSSPSVQAADVPSVAAVAASNRGSDVSQAAALTLARYQRTPKPAYPASARRLRQEGTVVLRVRVDPEGRVTAVQLKTSSGFAALDAAAAGAVRRWEFVPAHSGEQPVTSEVEVPVRFRLAKDDAAPARP
jgi:periplasmic protein TonB